VVVVANHFASKGGDQPLYGRFQPPNRSSEIQRTAQAAALRGFVDQLQRVDRRAAVVVLGDLNDFPFSPTLETLTARGGLRALVDTLPRGERYGYVFAGNSQALDHILVSRSLRHVAYDIVHINAEFADQASDHDPQVARIRLR
jgi:predicted extracellular nuclease